MTVETITHAEFRRRGEAQGVGLSPRFWAFVCPVCGTVQSMASLISAGLSEEDASKAIGFNCIGRYTNAGPPPRKPIPGYTKGCNWSLGGLLRLHNLVVVIDGLEHPAFELATAEQARAHKEACRLS